MSITIEFGSFRIECLGFSELESAWLDCGGDVEWLRNQLKGAITRVQHGDAAGLVVEKMGGTVIASTDLAQDAELESKPQTDPWASTGNTVPAERAPSGDSSTDISPVIITDKWNNRYTLGLPNAPNCDCGVKAAKVNATSKKGNSYVVWRCAKKSGASYRDACDYSEYPD